MSILVTDSGFAPDDWAEDIVALWDARDHRAIDLPASADPNELAGRLPALDMIRVDFPNVADGRGFTIARQLRRMGFTGRLRARGPMIADQYAMARRSGFDEIEIPEDIAARQTEDQWLARANWRAHDYQARLRARPAALETASAA